MPLVRFIVASNETMSSPAKDAIVNTLYFNVSQFDPTVGPDYQALTDDLWEIMATPSWGRGRFLDVRAYNMEDADPRPQKARKTGQVTGTKPTGPHQIALCLSYYADRNLPRQRGRIYVGPWDTSTTNATNAQTDELIALAGSLAGLGGLNVDWSLWSPTTNTHTRINHAWVDDSWDVIRSRKVASVAARKTWDGNG